MNNHARLQRYETVDKELKVRGVSLQCWRYIM